MTFEVVLKMRNFAELQARVAKGEHLSADEIAARYAPSLDDYQAVVSWIKQNGFTITRTAPNHLAVFAIGKVGQIARAMRVNFARVKVDGAEYTSAISAPSVPAGLVPALVGVNGLQPHIRARPDMMRKSIVTTITPFLPSQIISAYQAASLYSGNITGAGQTIALVDDTFVSPMDLQSFWTAAGVSQSLSNVEFIQAVPEPLQSPSQEASLDVEWASSLAPGAHVRVYGSGDFAITEVDQAYQQIYDDVTNHPEYGIHQLSLSYGYGETEITSSQAMTDDQYFTEIAAAGVTIFASSGDQGATPPAPSGNQSDGPGPQQAEFPASDPNVTGVGGTNITLSSKGTISSEVAWNDGDPAAFADASGGGVSIYFNRPVWQAGNGVGTGTMREVPDVASAADGTTGCLVIDDGEKFSAIGTSWSSPTWAAFCALFNQARENSGQADLGILGPHIYSLLSPTSTYAANFNDITQGNNIVWSGQGYTAGAGYDLVTGMGSPKVTALAQALAGTNKLVGIALPPAFVGVQPGQNASFVVSVKGATATYRWQYLPIGGTTWSNVPNASPFSGTTSATLTVRSATTALSGDEFRCLVTIGGITSTTALTALAVETPLTISQPTIQYSGTPGFTNFSFPSGIAIDNSGHLYVADLGNDAIRELTPTGVINTPYGAIGSPGSSDGIGSSASFNGPNAIAFDGNDTLYVADTGNNLIRTITLSTGQVSTLAGTNGEFDVPNGVAVDTSGNVYVANQNDQTICKVAQDGTVSVFAGQTGVAGYADGDGPTQALFNYPAAVAVDSTGNVYVADEDNSAIRKITPAGMVSTVAGIPGVAGYRDGADSLALFNRPVGVTVDGANNIYVADSRSDPQDLGNNLLREITPAGAVTTLAGQPGVAGISGGIGSAAQFQSPQAIAINSGGMFYIADTFNQTIRLGMPATPLKVAYLSGVVQKGVELSGVVSDGNVVVGAMATSTLTISNIGDAAFNVTSIQYPSGFSGNWNAGTIAAGASHNIVVTFSPSAEMSYGGPITVVSNANSTLGSFSASGAGVTAPSASLLTVEQNENSIPVPLSGPVDCGTVFLNAGKASPAAVLLVQNPTNTALAISSVTFPKGFSGTWNSQVPAGGAMVLNLYFNPTTVGSYSGNVVINSDFSGSPLTVPVTGLGESNATITTGSATIVNSSTANLFGSVIPNNSGPEVGFAYGVTAPYNTETPIQTISGAAITPISAQITGLLPNTLYHYQALISGGALGALKTFTTPVGQYLSNNPTAYVSAFGAQLVSQVSAGGVTSQAYFQYGTTSSYGSQTNAQTISGTSVISFSQGIIGLDPGMTYHYQLVVTNASGMQFGPDETFVAPPLMTTEVSETGAAANGISVGTYSTFGSAAVDGHDGVAFRAMLSGVAAASNSGIWATQGSTDLSLIAQTGSTAPGTGGAIFTSLTDPAYDDHQDVLFGGTLQVATGLVTTATENGVWASSQGVLGVLAREGSIAPGAGGATFASFTAAGLSDLGGAIVSAKLNLSSIAGVTAANCAGVWEGQTANALTLMLRAGERTDTMKTISSFIFLPTETCVNGQTRGFGVATGDLTANATYTDKTTGIVIVSSPGSPEAVVTSGDTADSSGDIFATFSSPAINDHDHVAFAGTISGTGVSAKLNASGLWADDSTGTLTLIARQGGNVPAPASGTFASFSDPVYTDNEAVAFRATITTTVAGRAATTTGIYATQGDLASLALVAGQGGQAPGFPTGVTFLSFSSLALSDKGGAAQEGGVIFVATLSGPGITTANNTAIFAVDNTGTLQRIVCTGDIYNGKTLTAFSFLPAEPFVSGQSRNFSAWNGDLVYNATFSDKTQAIFNVVFQ